MVNRRKFLTAVFVAIATIPLLRAQSILETVLPKSELEKNTLYYVWMDGAKLYCESEPTLAGKRDWLFVGTMKGPIAVDCPALQEMSQHYRKHLTGTVSGVMGAN